MSTPSPGIPCAAHAVDTCMDGVTLRSPAPWHWTRNSNLDVVSSNKFSGNGCIAERATGLRQAKPWPVR
jgi:hypothetical protein